MHSNIFVRSCIRVVKSTASISGFPLLVESVSELDHIPSKELIFGPFSISKFSAMSPLKPSWVSRILTIGFAAISLRNAFNLISGVVPIPRISFPNEEELMPFVYGISTTSPPISCIVLNTASRNSLSLPSFQSSP